MGLWQPILNLKLNISVILVGFDGDHRSDDDSLEVDAKTLRVYLEEVFPSYLPPIQNAVESSATVGSTKTGAAKHTNQHGRSTSPLQVRYKISYAVKHASTESHNDYLDALANAAMTSEDGEHRPLLVPIDAISQAVEMLALKESGITASPNNPVFDETEVTILVANPSRAGLRARFKNRGKLNEKIEVAGAADAGYSLAEPASLYRVQKGAADWSSEADSNERPSTCVRSWVGQRRVLIVDLGAVACRYWDLPEHDPYSTVMEGLFLSGNAQGNYEYWLNESGTRRGVTGSRGVAQPGKDTPDPATVFSVKLSSLVISAVRTTLAPSVPGPPGPGDTSEIVMVPLIFFRGSFGGNIPEVEDPLTLNGLLDIPQVSKAVNAMALPEQEVVVVGATHYFSEHPQMAVAIERSLATNTKFYLHEGKKDVRPNFEVLQEGHLRSGRLLSEVKLVGDELVSSLLSEFGADHLLRLDATLATEGRPEIIHRLDGAGVKILPVFVFCLEHTEDPFSDASAKSETAGDASDGPEQGPRKELPARLFEGNSPFAAEVGGDSVLVLQSEHSAPIPFFERSETLRLPLLDATQAVMAGILKVMHGTTAPDHWWPLEQDTATLDLSWAHGYHPFSPFGFGGSEPGQLFVDVARRNAVASRAASVAAALAEASRVLEEFAETAVPNELLLPPGYREVLCRDGAATKEGWGDIFESAAASAGLPADLVTPVMHVHRLIREAVGTFEGDLATTRARSLTELVTAMDRAQDRASSFLVQATQAARGLESCKCTTARVSSPSNLSWTVFLVALLVIAFSLVRVSFSARRALFKYVRSTGAGPRARW